MTTKLLTIESRTDGLPLSVLLALPEGEPRARWFSFPTAWRSIRSGICR